jgi:predicted 2-oxoglutarate/Fe(II)-dependent dioxygenase YbiX
MTREPLNGDSIFVIRDFATSSECDSFIAQSESSGYEEATIATATGAIINKDVRNNARLIHDDPDLADRLWQRAKPFMPPWIGAWRATGFNERFRYYRYDPGQQFAPHGDGSLRRENGEESQLTFMVYLNDDFTGGETVFYEEPGKLRLSVRPERGMALIFVHRQWHAGAPVLAGRKYVLRTDVMYVHNTSEAA